MKNVDGPAVRLVDEADAALAGVPAELAVTSTDIAAACREGFDGRRGGGRVGHGGGDQG